VEIIRIYTLPSPHPNPTVIAYQLAHPAGTNVFALRPKLHGIVSLALLLSLSLFYQYLSRPFVLPLNEWL